MIVFLPQDALPSAQNECTHNKMTVRYKPVWSHCDNLHLLWVLPNILNQEYFGMMKLLFLQMESGGFNESDSGCLWSQRKDST